MNLDKFWNRVEKNKKYKKLSEDDIVIVIGDNHFTKGELRNNAVVDSYITHELEAKKNRTKTKKKQPM